MYNHIAVILRGHVRTWKYIHTNIFKFYKSLARSVDYYFISWEDSIIDSDVPTTFTNNGENLEKIIYLSNKSVDVNIYNGFTGPSRMCWELVPWIRQKQKITKYDFIVETRPDIFPFHNETFSYPFYLEPNTMYVPHLEIHNNGLTGLDEIAVPDWLLIYDTHSFETMAQRYIYNDHIGAQIQWVHFAKQEGIKISIMRQFGTFITRPSVYSVDMNLEIQLLKSEIGNSIGKWNNSSHQEKLEIIKQARLSLFDYMTRPSSEGFNKCLP